ncbi:unnamed protein product, partial [Didymodactylos carnosus]
TQKLNHAVNNIQNSNVPVSKMDNGAISSFTNTMSLDPKHELMTEIAQRYRLAARRLRESQSTLIFDIEFPVHDILKVDATTNEITFRAALTLNYQFESNSIRDNNALPYEFLSWDSNNTQSRYYQIDDITLTPATLNSLWLPEMKFDDERVQFNVEREIAKINREGLVRWTRRGTFTVASIIDLQYYPFDKHSINLNLHNTQKSFKLQYRRLFASANGQLNARTSVWNTLFGSMTGIKNNENETSSTTSGTINYIKTSSRGWFITNIQIQPKIINENSSVDDLLLSLSIQRRRETHIFTIIVPCLFFSFFIFIFYFQPVEAHQRLIIGVLNSLATLTFYLHLDYKIEAQQLTTSPLILQFLTILFMIEAISLFFDHIIHSIFYGGINFVSQWLRRNRHKSRNYDTQHPARLSRVTVLSRALNEKLRGSNVNGGNGTNGNRMSLEYGDTTLINHHQQSTDVNSILKQLFEREENLKLEDNERYQWRKRARLSECLCCWFFFAIVIAAAICVFAVIPSIGIKKF